MEELNGKKEGFCNYSLTKQKNKWHLKLCSKSFIINETHQNYFKTLFHISYNKYKCLHGFGERDREALPSMRIG